MKSKYYRLFCLNRIALAVFTAGALMSLASATTYTWTGYNGNWSDPSNWDSNGVPSNDGTADVVASTPGGQWATVNPGSLASPSTNWSIHSLTSSAIDEGLQFNAVGSSSLSIGAGGISVLNGNQVYYDLALIATASQPWYVGDDGSGNGYPLYIGWPSGNPLYGADPSGSSSVVTLNDGVNVTKTGNGSLIFLAGITTTVGSGHFTLEGGTITLNGTDQYGSLGTNPLGVTANPSSQRPLLYFVDTASGTFANGFTFTGGLVNSNITIGWGNGQTDYGTTLTVTGPLSGALSGGWTNGTGFMTPQIWTAPSSDDRYSIIFQGDGSGLSSTHSTDPFSYGILHISSGVDVLDNANALGTGNSLSVFVGRNDNRVTNSYVGLLATNNAGSVSSPIKVRQAENGTQHYHGVVELGLSGYGSVAFTGPIHLDNQWPVNSGYVQHLKLTAPAGGTATFSGVISDSDSTTGASVHVPVTVLADGTVKLSGNNTYKGSTSIRSGTLLVGGYNNALGYQGTSAANVSLGGVVTAPSGGDVVAATTSALPGTYTWTAGTFSWPSGAPTTLDGVFLNIGDRILVKDAFDPYDAQDGRNGVYVFTDANTWTRSSDMNTTAPFVAGLRVHVTGGTLNGSKNFYLTWGLVPGAALNNNDVTSSTNGLFVFNPDASSFASVALLTDEPLTISRNIDVTNNLSPGPSTLGGNSADASTFSGTVNLSKDLTVTASFGGSVTFSGDIIGSNNLTAVGAGQVVFSTDKSYTGTTSVSFGTLEVDGNLASSGVTVGIGVSSPGGPHPSFEYGGGRPTPISATLQGTGTLAGTLSVSSSGLVSPGLAAGDTMHAGATTITGHLAAMVNGASANKLISSSSINLTGGTVDVTVGGGGFTQPYYVIAQGSSITGMLPSVTTGYTLTNTGTELRLSQALSNSFTAWIAGYSGLSDTTPGGNPSHDGISNLVKYALDLNPTVSAQPAGTHTGSSLTFTKGTMAKADSNLTYSIEESTDLATWGAPTLGSVSYGDTITYTYPSGQSKVFARLKVVQTP